MATKTSTAALDRIAQKRALHSPAAALSQASAAYRATRPTARIADAQLMEEPAMNEQVEQGTKQQKHSRAKEILRAAGLSIAVLAFVGVQKAATREDNAIPTNRPVDRAAVENLQRWVSGGHDQWCKDPALVASAELRRVAPQFSGDQFDLAALPVQQESRDESTAVFSWTTADGRTTYRISLKRYAWLLPIAGRPESIVWFPASVETIAGE